MVIDETKNSHGHAFIDFLVETKLAIANGRCCPLSDRFTSISHNGKSVVDIFSQIIDFKVKPITELVDEMNLMSIAEGRISEHSVLKMSFHVGQIETWNALNESVNKSRVKESFAEVYPPEYGET